MIGIVAFSVTGVVATDYYFDSKNGNDENAGTSPETAWQTLEKVNSATFSPGDRVLFKRNGLWRGSLDLQSGSEEAPLVYTSYGEGMKPRFFGSVPLDEPENWINEEGKLWATDPALTPLFRGTDIGNIILNGKSAAFKRWTKEDLKAQNDFWFDLKGDRRVWFYSEMNPAILFVQVEAAVMRHVINHSGANYVTVDGFDVRYGGAHGFGGGGVDHLTIRNCAISWIGGGDQNKEGGDGRRVRFGNGIEFWGEARNCLIENNQLWEIYDAALTNQGSGTNVEENIVYRNNLIMNSEYSFEYWNGPDDSITRNILFEKNACYNAGYGWGHVQRPDKNGRHVMIYSNQARTENFVIQDNLFYNATESIIRVDRCKSNEDWPGKGLTMNRNLYFTDDNRPLFRWLGDEYFADSFSFLQEEFGLEKDGVVYSPEDYPFKFTPHQMMMTAELFLDDPFHKSGQEDSKGDEDGISP